MRERNGVSLSERRRRERQKKHGMERATMRERNGVSGSGARGPRD
jgi:hypothetical protein